MTAININAQEAVQRLTLRVRLHGVQTLRFRTWLGACLIRMGARVIGCGVAIEQDSKSLMRSDMEARASTMNLRPGDAVVVEVPHPIPRDGRERMAADLRHVFGEDRKVLVLDGGATIKAISNDGHAGISDAWIKEELIHALNRVIAENDTNITS